MYLGWRPYLVRLVARLDGDAEQLEPMDEEGTR